MEKFKEVIIRKLLNGYANAQAAEQPILDKISTAIQWAWDNWDTSVVETYYEGDKPKYPTEDFTTQWVNNNSFEADGYDEELLTRIFSPRKTFDIHFNNSENSNSKGFKQTYAYCMGWINLGTMPPSYFEDYKGGKVSIVCNETGETVYEENIN